jgi:hypothetical protein
MATTTHRVILCGVLLLIVTLSGCGSAEDSDTKPVGVSRLPVGGPANKDKMMEMQKQGKGMRTRMPAPTPGALKPADQ